jgi:hypothetical protein
VEWLVVPDGATITLSICCIMNLDRGRSSGGNRSACAAKRPSEASLKNKRFVLSKRLLHSTVWLAMRPQDRQVFADLSDKYDADGKVSLKLLTRAVNLRFKGRFKV